MELKDLLPLFGIAIGWLLAEASTFGKRVVERKRTVGKGISVLYFLFMEMVQLKTAQEKFKNLGKDVKGWERLRQRSFEKYTSQDSALMESLNATVDSLGEYYPIEAYKLREVLIKYQLVKSKKLDIFTENPGLYIEMLSIYELEYMAHQYQLELIIRFLAFQQSKLLWARIRYHFWRMRSRVPKGDMIFLQQATFSKRRAAISTTGGEQEALPSKEPTSGA